MMNTTNLLITNAQLRLLIEKKDPILIFDCRFDLSKSHIGKEHYLEGHIPSAVYIDLEKDLSGTKNPLLGRHPLPSPSDWAITRSRLGITKNSQSGLYDHQENTYSARMWWMLMSTGHTNIQILDGGYHSWLDSQGAIEVGETKHTSPLSDALPIAYEHLFTMKDVQENLSSKAFQIIDARTAERFRGDVEPLDPVAGHIPGAINRLYKKNLKEGSSFKTPEVLRQEWSSVNLPPSSIVHQCGSGVTACHNLFAMELAGLKGSKLYAGSWSEWCNHPTNLMAKGD